MSEYKLKPGKIGKKAVSLYKQTEERFTQTFLEEDGSLKPGPVGRRVTDAFHKLEDGVTDGYRAVEKTVVGGYKKVEDAFVDRLLERVDEEQPGQPEQPAKDQH